MGSEANEVIEDYRFLKPEKASFWDVFIFILPFIGSKKLRKLIDCPKGKEESHTKLKSRVLIFVSISLLKIIFILIRIYKVIKKLCPPFLGFIFNEGEGKSEDIEITNKERNGTEDCWKLTESGDSVKYYGTLTILASKLAYSNSHDDVMTVVKDNWKMELLEHKDFQNDFETKDSTRALMFNARAKDENMMVVAFRGTDTLDVKDWMVDFSFSWYKIKGAGKVHRGFLQALGAQNTKPNTLPKNLSETESNFAYHTICQMLQKTAKDNPKARFIITGHSFGGALATLFVALLAIHEESNILDKIEAVYTFGQPRVGDAEFKKYVERNVILSHRVKYYRYEYYFDLVTRFPFNAKLIGYKHFGQCYYYGSFFNFQILSTLLNQDTYTYKNVKEYFFKGLNHLESAVNEPIFAGLIERMKIYFKTTLAGLSAHKCSNYINLVRTGKMKLKKPSKP